jgi:hypothetical protein
MDGARRPAASSRSGLRICLVAQLISILLLAFLPFGFDQPSRLGLDFEHFLLLLGLYACALLPGLVLAGVKKQWPWIWVQLFGPLIGGAALAMGSL